MSYRAGGAGARRHGTSAAEAPQCAGFAVLLRWHGRYAGAPQGGDASKTNVAGRRPWSVQLRGDGSEAAA